MVRTVNFMSLSPLPYYQEMNFLIRNNAVWNIKIRHSESPKMVILREASQAGTTNSYLEHASIPVKEEYCHFYGGSGPM